MALLHQCGNGNRIVKLCLTANDFGLQDDNKTGWGTTRKRERERGGREIQMDRKGEKEGGRVQCFIENGDMKLISPT